ncbi:unnamed protein product [Polarella glacialis]|uniref:Pentatricopeptide repeat-containing protein, chloroplastic n=1 Tax=Polarella glacialis TaxID=89957 RepID=A0A813GC42_POLGL|nr:unnamed protein product [Polarella glacialis]
MIPCSAAPGAGSHEPFITAKAALCRVFASSFSRGKCREAQQQGPKVPIQDPQWYTAGIANFGRLRKWEMALAMHREMKAVFAEPNTFTHNAALSACSQGRRWEAGILLARGMGQQGISMDTVTFNCAVRACAHGAAWERCLGLVFGAGGLIDLRRLLASSASKLEPDEVTQNSLANGLDAGEQWGRSLCMLRDWIARGLRPEVIACNAGISVCGKVRRWDWSIRALWEMQRLGLEANLLSFELGLTACARGQGAPWPWALALLRDIGGLGVAADSTARARNAAVSACDKAMQWEWALHLVVGPNPTQGNVACSGLLAACQKASQWHLALRLVSSRVGHWASQDAVLRTGAVRAVADAGLWQDALEQLWDFRRVGLELDAAASGAALAAYESSGRWAEALDLLACLGPLRLAPDAAACGSMLHASASSLSASSDLLGCVAAILHGLGRRTLQAMHHSKGEKRGDTRDAEREARNRVLASELLLQHLHGLPADLQAALRRRTLAPTLPRLRRLVQPFRSNEGAASLWISDPLLEQQFGIGSDLCLAVLSNTDGLLGGREGKVSSRVGNRWLPEASSAGRIEMQSAATSKEAETRQPASSGQLAARQLVAWVSAALEGKANDVQCRGRTAAYGVSGASAMLSGLYVRHDRSGHAERSALLGVLQGLQGLQDGTADAHESAPRIFS